MPRPANLSTIGAMSFERCRAQIAANLGRHPWLADVLLALGAGGVALILKAGDTGNVRVQPDSGVADAVGFGFALLAIAARRRFTIAALVVCVVAAIGIFATADQDSPALTLAFLLLMFTYADREGRQRAWPVAGIVSLVILIAGGALGMIDTATFGIAWTALGTALGDATHTRRAYLVEVVERARQAERSRDDEARMRVTEERLRIARELHDVVAHHIAAVKIQASGAKHIARDRPEQVEPALEHIRRLSDEVLKEMASMIGLLRVSPEQDSFTVEPTRGLAGLPRLLEDFAAVGLMVHHEQIGTARELTVMADLAAYRIIQEGLTNAQKYGDGTAHLTLDYAEKVLTIRIVNPVVTDQEARTPSGTGHGLLGMSERAVANGGTLVSGPTAEGTFEVNAVLVAEGSR
jgi:signal transduction histidine kinase